MAFGTFHPFWALSAMLLVLLCSIGCAYLPCFCYIRKSIEFAEFYFLPRLKIHHDTACEVIEYTVLNFSSPVSDILDHVKARIDHEDTPLYLLNNGHLIDDTKSIKECGLTAWSNLRTSMTAQKFQGGNEDIINLCAIEKIIRTNRDRMLDILAETSSTPTVMRPTKNICADWRKYLVPVRRIEEIVDWNFNQFIKLNLQRQPSSVINLEDSIRSEILIVESLVRNFITRVESFCKAVPQDEEKENRSLGFFLYLLFYFFLFLVLLFFLKNAV